MQDVLIPFGSFSVSENPFNRRSARLYSFYNNDSLGSGVEDLDPEPAPEGAIETGATP